jgi:hypothetical protein
VILSENSEAKKLSSGELLLNSEQCDKLKAHCIANYKKEVEVGISWSPLCCYPSPRRDEAILAIGDAAGSIALLRYNSRPILIFSFIRGQGLQVKCIWKLAISERLAITHLAWSPWIDMPESSLLDKCSILAASMNDGTVHLAKIMSTSEADRVDICEIQSDMTRELLPKQRIPVSKLAWKQRTDDLVLFITRNGGLTVSIHSLERTEELSSEILSCRHDNYSPVVGIFLCYSSKSDMILSASERDLDIMIVSQLLPITTFKLSATNELVPLPPSTELTTFFDNKHDLYTPSGTKDFFKIFGVNASYNNTVLNFYFECVTDAICY